MRGRKNKVYLTGIDGISVIIMWWRNTEARKMVKGQGWNSSLEQFSSLTVFLEELAFKMKTANSNIR